MLLCVAGVGVVSLALGQKSLENRSERLNSKNNPNKAGVPIDQLPGPVVPPPFALASCWSAPRVRFVVLIGYANEQAPDLSHPAAASGPLLRIKCFTYLWSGGRPIPLRRVPTLAEETSGHRPAL